MPTLTTLVSFNDTNGSTPLGGLMFDGAGNLFGTTSGGGALGSGGNGTVYEIVKTGDIYANTPTTLVSFKGTNGRMPVGDLIADSAGNLFGVTNTGGLNFGTVFEIAKTDSGYANTPTVLVKFDPKVAAFPHAGLLADSAGNLFGTTGDDTGRATAGTVFEIVKTAAGYASIPTILANFTGPNGIDPMTDLIADSAGNLFGMTFRGGANNSGTVFELVNNGGSYTLTTLVNLDLNTTGNGSFGGLTMDAAGNLFGTTQHGGGVASGFIGKGTVFEIAKTSGGYASTPTILVTFDVNGTSGAAPAAGLLIDAVGNLFGTTNSGGATNNGTVFELVNKGGSYTLTTLVSFKDANGRLPS